MKKEKGHWQTQDTGTDEKRHWRTQDTGTNEGQPLADPERASIYNVIYVMKSPTSWHSAAHVSNHKLVKGLLSRVLLT